MKQAIDKEDKYVIFRINNSQFNGQPDYIFKSSSPMTQLAIDMDQDGLKHPLQGKEAYCDGCHSRCAGYKTLALFVYHTAMHCILRLAMMEVRSESTHEISIFWKLFNEILNEIKGRNYKFNPKSIMVDENGANYYTIRKVFGLEIATSKVVSCQMHYKNDVNRVSLKIGDSYKDVFKSICHECVLSLLLLSTMTERSNWRRLLTYSHRLLHGSIGGMLGNTTFFLLLGDWVTQM